MSHGEFYNKWISPQRYLERIGIRPPAQIVIGLVLLTLCVLLFAQALRLVPGDDDASLRVRAVLAEMAASRAASAMTTGDYAEAKSFFDSLIQRYDDVLSVALRRRDGSMAVETSKHETNWIGAKPNLSSPTHIRVQLFEEQGQWGQLEISFKPLHPSITRANWSSIPMVRLTAFVLGGAFLLYWLFLARMLRVLDPSGAVPERTQILMDTLVEGLVIIDEDEQIVMSNQSFARTAFMPEDRLIGRTLSSLPWLNDEGKVSREDHPWKAAQRSNLAQRSVRMRLQIGNRHERRLNVNASPILDPNGKRRGVLVTFDDQTVLESTHQELARLVGRFSQGEGGLRKLYEQLGTSVDDAQFEKLEELVRTARELATDLCCVTSADATASVSSMASQLEQPSRIIPDGIKGSVVSAKSPHSEP